jgi:hypothetical protein
MTAKVIIFVAQIYAFIFIDERIIEKIWEGIKNK